MLNDQLAKYLNWKMYKMANNNYIKWKMEMTFGKNNISQNLAKLKNFEVHWVIGIYIAILINYPLLVVVYQ
jgi:hypothetical protein